MPQEGLDMEETWDIRLAIRNVPSDKSNNKIFDSFFTL